MFFEHWKSLDSIASALPSEAGGFSRGLPIFGRDDLNACSLDLLRELAREGTFSAVDLDITPNISLHGEEEDRAHAARQMRRNGWVYVSSVQNDDNDYDKLVIMEVASPLHRAWFSSTLQNRKPIDPKFTTLDFLWTLVLRGFSAAALRNPVRTRVSSRRATFVEAQYQQEFYRSLYKLTEGACCVSPEYGGQTSSTRKGRIDFFIGTKRWGIELLRDGDRIDGHVSRFQAGGAYHPWTVSGNMDDYVILDFCKVLPSTASSKCFLISSCLLPEFCLQMLIDFSTLSTIRHSRNIKPMIVASTVLVVLLDF
jgi:hypothetical protein